MKQLKKYNHWIDSKLIQWHVKKHPKSDFEKEFIDFLQLLLMNINGGLILEDALMLSINTIKSAHELNQQALRHQSAIKGLNFYANTLNNEHVWRLTRLLNQAHKTGSDHLEQALEKMYANLWTEKTANFKKKSEQVSVGLTFLLMLSLISVIVVVISPILLIF